jgi:hypothetical protein
MFDMPGSRGKDLRDTNLRRAIELCLPGVPTAHCDAPAPYPSFEGENDTWLPEKGQEERAADGHKDYLLLFFYKIKRHFTRELKLKVTPSSSSPAGVDSSAFWRYNLHWHHRRWYGPSPSFRAVRAEAPPPPAPLRTPCISSCASARRRQDLAPDRRRKRQRLQTSARFGVSQASRAVAEVMLRQSVA